MAWRNGRFSSDASRERPFIQADRLRALPIDFREATRVTDVVMDGDRVTGVRALDAASREHVLKTPLVIAADGRASVVAERLGCRHPHRLRRMALATYVTGLRDCRCLSTARPISNGTSRPTG